MSRSATRALAVVGFIVTTATVASIYKSVEHSTASSITIGSVGGTVESPPLSNDGDTFELRLDPKIVTKVEIAFETPAKPGVLQKALQSATFLDINGKKAFRSHDTNGYRTYTLSGAENDWIPFGSNNEGWVDLTPFFTEWTNKIYFLYGISRETPKGITIKIKVTTDQSKIQWAKKSVGQSCSKDDECHSAHCISGACKNVRCGDGTCEKGYESYENCSSDCDRPRKPNGSSCYSNNECITSYCDRGTCADADTCGNGKCGSQESCQRCPADCGKCPNGEQCDSDSMCTAGSCINYVCASACGNGKCDTDRGESCSTCQKDCGSCKKDDGSSCSYGNDCKSGYCVHGTCRSSSTYCGDGHCEGKEDCNTCSRDCGTCKKEDGERCSSGLECKGHYCVDGTCRSHDLVCGDGRCEEPETCSNCSQDCGKCAPTIQQSGEYCKRGSECVTGHCEMNICLPKPHCGDGRCTSPEECSNCPTDCGKCRTEPKPNGAPCDVDSECKSKYCRNGMCVEKGRCGDNTCDASIGESCETCFWDCGECPRSKTEGASCKSSSQCALGYVCDNGRCTDQDKYTRNLQNQRQSSSLSSSYAAPTYDDDQCRLTTDCPRGHVCRQGECITNTFGQRMLRRAQSSSVRTSDNRIQEHTTYQSAPECRRNYDCPGSQICRRGKCKEQPSRRQPSYSRSSAPPQITRQHAASSSSRMNRGTCGRNSDCPQGFACRRQQCVEQAANRRIRSKMDDSTELYDITYTTDEGLEVHEEGKALEVLFTVNGEEQDGAMITVEKGSKVKTHMTIKNVSDKGIALITGITFDGVQYDQDYYHVRYDWSSGFSALWGKEIDDEYIIMPAETSITVYSHVYPQETGYLKAYGMTYFTPERTFVDRLIEHLHSLPRNYKEEWNKAEFTKMLEVQCTWPWPWCP